MLASSYQIGPFGLGTSFQFIAFHFHRSSLFERVARMTFAGCLK
jgi:hypothetical protein